MATSYTFDITITPVGHERDFADELKRLRAWQEHASTQDFTADYNSRMWEMQHGWASVRDYHQDFNYSWPKAQSDARIGWGPKCVDFRYALFKISQAFPSWKFSVRWASEEGIWPGSHGVAEFYAGRWRQAKLQVPVLDDAQPLTDVAPSWNGA